MKESVARPGKASPRPAEELVKGEGESRMSTGGENDEYQLQL